MVLAALRAGRRQVPVHGLVDVTEAAHRIVAAEVPLSISAFVAASVARAVALNPEVAAYRDWFGRLVIHHHVDVAMLVEVDAGDTRFPLAHVIRDADVRSVGDLSAEIRSVKTDAGASPSGRLLHGSARWLTRVPGLWRLIYVAMARSSRMRARTGTVAVTAIGMFAGGSGSGIAHPTTMTLTVLIGGMSDRPVVVEGAIAVRTMLDVTITVDHRVVDGAPAARFAADLRRILENAEVLQ